MRAAAGLPHARFHYGRHTAITTLAEKGLPDWVTQAQVGHVSPAMMKTYSHIRRQALNEAAAALEPNPAKSVTDSNPPDSAQMNESQEVSNPTDSSSLDAAKRASEENHENRMSQFTSQNDVSEDEAIEFVREFGSSGWTRTSNPPVNSHFFQGGTERSETITARFIG